MNLNSALNALSSGNMTMTAADGVEGEEEG
jgi:hypothetical protein